MVPSIELYDTTLRDGAQGRRVKFSADDQIRVVQALDAFGIHFIEGGQPGSNPKAADLFKRARDLELQHAKMTAFGSTRNPRSHAVEDDANIKALLAAETEYVTIFAKTSRLHAEQILRVSLDDNLQLVRDSVQYLRSEGRRVILDAEHFFDGFFDDAEYALSVLETSAEAGAEALVLCDTNGGCMPWQIASTIERVQERLPNARLGIHAHNDSGCGVANTLEAVRRGVVHVQGTINGYGERTGNANLTTIIPSLQIKMGLEAVSPGQLEGLTRMSHLVAELANLVPDDSAPYVGRDAFTHKGGMHADAVHKVKSSYEHIEPEVVGNKTHVSISEVSGRSSLLQKAHEFGIALERDTPQTREVLQAIKEMENQGYEFEGADASLEILIRNVTGELKEFFKFRGFRVSVERSEPGQPSLSEASVKLELPNGQIMHTVSEGEGPVDALNNAIRKALDGMYPELAEAHLEDYKVRILNSQDATRAKTRVLIESSDEESTWDTVGVSENIIAASYDALIDSIVYKLLRSRTDSRMELAAK